MPNEILKEKAPSKSPGLRHLVAGVVQFLGWVTLFFSVVDILVTGAWKRLGPMILTADGRCLILIAGIVGVSTSWSLHQASHQNDE